MVFYCYFIVFSLLFPLLFQAAFLYLKLMARRAPA